MTPRIRGSFPSVHKPVGAIHESPVCPRKYPLDKILPLCYTIRVKTLTKNSKQVFFAQRAVGWCKTVKEICRIPLRVALQTRESASRR